MYKLMKKWPVLLLTAGIVLLLLPVQIFAADCPYTIKVEADRTTAAVGDQVKLTCSLEGYNNAALTELSGVQVNINQVTEEMSPSGIKTLISQNSYMYNSTGYNRVKKSIVLLYMSSLNAADTGDYLPRSTIGLVEGTITIPESAAGQEQLVLPVQVILIDKNNKNYTIKTSIAIALNSGGGSEESVDIQWQSMNFEWKNGIWDPDEHRYLNQGWTTDGGGITITNRTGSSTKVQFRFTSLLEEIQGTVLDESGASADSYDIATKESRQFHLQLNGKPSRELKQEKIGEITVRIGGE